MFISLSPLFHHLCTSLSLPRLVPDKWDLFNDLALGGFFLSGPNSATSTPQSGVSSTVYLGSFDTVWYYSYCYLDTPKTPFRSFRSSWLHFIYTTCFLDRIMLTLFKPSSFLFYAETACTPEQQNNPFCAHTVSLPLNSFSCPPSSHGSVS